MKRASSTIGLVLLLAACGSAEVPPAEPTAPPPAEPTAPAVVATAAAATVQVAATVAPVETAPVPVASATASVAASASASVAPSAAPAATVAPVAGANLHVGSMTADGLTIDDLSCKADGLGLFGALVVVGSLSKHKKALDACSAGGDRARVEWAAAAGKMSQVKVKAKTPAVEKCLTKVLASAPAPFEGTCAATLVLGAK